jgi:predicted O-methyltransferase YrrM
MLLRDRSTLVVDNVVSHAEEVRELISMIQHDSRFILSTVNMGAGLLFVLAR